MDIALYLLLGAVAGFLAGLLGVGGGLIIVPVLDFLLLRQGVGAGMAMHLALGTSLATIILTSISSIRAHHARGAVLWPAVARLTPGIVVGALLGSALVDALAGGELRLIFGIFVLAVAAQLAFGIRPSPHRELPGRAGMAGAGGVIGFVSAIVGIGGGSLTVPFLAWCNTPMRNAVATSAACGLPIAVAGAAGYVVAGQGEAALPDFSLGYVYLPALAGVAAASILSAPLGARVAHAVSGEVLKRLFAALLALIALRMLTS